MVVAQKGKALARVCEPREELKVFPTNERSDYAKPLASDEWMCKAGVPGRYFSSSE